MPTTHAQPEIPVSPASGDECLKLIRERREKLRLDMHVLRTCIDEVDLMLRALGDETAPTHSTSSCQVTSRWK